MTSSPVTFRPEPRYAAPRGAGLHGLVMVVDDEATVRSALTKILRAEGFDVVTAHGGRGVLDSVRLLRPDAVLLDVMMTDPDGFEVCRRIRADPETRLTPVVLLTGLATVQDRVNGYDAGADDFLTKPVERIELVARLRSLLRAKQYTDQLEHTEAVVLALARSIEAKDPSTAGHCARLSRYATELGRRLGLSEEELTALERAGIVHDIGKVAVPDAILLKPGPLTPEEWQVVRKHPITGEHMCAPIHSFRQVLPIIRYHHERWDGSGYPDGLAAIEIPVTARVLQVVDVYDALTTERPYKRAVSHQEALQTLHAEVQRGWWDPEVFEAFRQFFGAAKRRQPERAS